MPTAEQQQTKKALKPRFKVDPAASPMPETKQPERLAPRATSNRKGGRDHLGILGDIKSVHPGEIIGIRRLAARANAGYVSGLYDVEGMTPYVNNGTALWPGFALRLGRPSELTRITLRQVSAT